MLVFFCIYIDRNKLIEKKCLEYLYIKMTKKPRYVEIVMYDLQIEALQE